MPTFRLVRERRATQSTIFVNCLDCGNKASQCSCALPQITPTKPLTSREVEVAIALAQGLSYKEVAARLGIAPKSVNSHVTGISGKLRGGGRVLLVHYVLQQGWVRVGDVERPRYYGTFEPLEEEKVNAAVSGSS